MMASAMFKEPPTVAFPRTLLSIVASVGGLALFLIVASSVLVSQPIGSTVRGYFYGVDSSSKIDLAIPVNKTAVGTYDVGDDIGERGKSNLTDSEGKGTEVGRSDDNRSKNDLEDKDDQTSESLDKNGLSNSGIGSGVKNSSSPPVLSGSKDFISQPMLSNMSKEEDQASTGVTNGVQNANSGASSSFSTQTEQKDANPQSGGVNSENVKSSYHYPINASQTNLVGSECNLYDGKWIYDSTGPLYTNNSCPVLTQMQNCQGNGRPDKDYENWRWKPSQCDLPRFDPKKFLQLMRGKTVAFIGDSVARNQMESMLCILWQVEVPKNRGNKKMQRYYFRSTSTMIVRIWSSWLVHQTSEPFDFAPAGVVKLHLDASDEGFMEYITEFDVVVLSSGHWFAKQSVYILNNEIVGGQLWWPDKSRKKKIDNVEAFGISVETILSAMVTHPNYTGITIVRSYSPDHYEGGAWNTGGSCTGKVKPALDGELAENGFTNIMHEKQVTGFDRAIKKKTNKSTLKLMDITKVFEYRHDGHPGPYRSPDPNKKTQRGPDGRPPPQDCLHWCMPGPVDTWNELVFEITRRELEGRTSAPS